MNSLVELVGITCGVSLSLEYARETRSWYMKALLQDARPPSGAQDNPPRPRDASALAGRRPVASGFRIFACRCSLRRLVSTNFAWAICEITYPLGGIFQTKTGVESKEYLNKRSED